MSNHHELAHMVRVCEMARDDQWGVLSTGEKLAAALVLNRPEWLAAMRYTMLEAIARIGPQWMALLPVAARLLETEALDTQGKCHAP